MFRVFIGYDARTPISYTVLQHSIISNSSKPVAITPLIVDQLPFKKVGITEFSFTRFLVPYLCDYEGTALFFDSDMVVTGDIVELFELVAKDIDAIPLNYKDSVYIVKDQPRFEWCSLMLFNNPKCKALTLDYLNSDKDVRAFEWANGIGELPKEWNHAVGYQKPTESKLYHYTQGIPYWDECKDLEAAPWEQAYKDMLWTESWDSIMGQSIHAKEVRQRLDGTKKEYISEDYRLLQWKLHERGDYGITGTKYGTSISQIVNKLGHKSILDYGCGFYEFFKNRRMTLRSNKIIIFWINWLNKSVVKLPRINHALINRA